jgi:hypothetical protein
LLASGERQRAILQTLHLRGDFLGFPPQPMQGGLQLPFLDFGGSDSSFEPGRGVVEEQRACTLQD